MKLRVPLIIGASLIGVGLITSVSVLAIKQFDFKGFDSNVVSKTYDITEEFTSIDVDLTSSDFNIYLSNDGTNKAVCLEKENITFEVKVEENTLKIIEHYDYEFSLLPSFTEIDVSLFVSKDVYETLNVLTTSGDVNITDSFTFNDVNIDVTTGDVLFDAKANNNIQIKSTTGDIGLYKVMGNNLTVNVSTGDVDIVESKLTGNVDIKVTTGDIEIEDLSCNDLKCKSTTGDRELSDITCNNINIESTTGMSKLDNVVASGDINIKSGSGDITLEHSDAKNIYIEATSGDVSGTILTDKIFNASSTSGDVRVPSSNTGGICQIKTTSGDINISIK